MIDLHTHSIFSDGTCTPTEIINKAEKLNMKAVALTDHNTLAGVREFVEAAEGKCVEAICGVEISTSYKDREIHVVGLFLPVNGTKELNELLAEQAKIKEISTIKTIKKLNTHGYNISYEKILSENPCGSINRTHIAKELMEAGYIGSIREAFYTLLNPNYGYFKEMKKPKTADVINLIKRAGGTSVIAHPLSKPTNAVIYDFLKSSVSQNLDAIEVQYGGFTRSEQIMAHKIAKRFGLLESTGSDFHGENKPDIKLGTGINYNMHADDSILELLRERAITQYAVKH